MMYLGWLWLSLQGDKKGLKQAMRLRDKVIDLQPRIKEEFDNCRVQSLLAWQL